ncbi:MAG: hypothetical protein AB7Y46_05835 [Armatimonadota bacterium]
MMDELWRDETGVATVEYLLLLALVVAIGVLAWSALGEAITDRLGQTASALVTSMD